MAHADDRSFYRFLKATPIATYAIVYFLTCVLASTFILLESRSFIVLFQFFSGMRVRQFSAAEKLLNWTLLLGSPVLLIAGYFVGWKIGSLTSWVPETLLGKAQKTKPPSYALAVAVFALTASIALWSFGPTGTASLFSGWFDYAAMVEQRYEHFRRVSFFGFVTIYTLVPLSAAILLNCSLNLKSRRLRCASSALSIVISSLLMLLLFQKKFIVLNLLMLTIAFVGKLIASGYSISKISRLALAAITGVVVCYTTLVVVPVYSANSRAISDIDPTKLQLDEDIARLSEEERARYFALRERIRRSSLDESDIYTLNSLSFSSRSESLFFYTLLAPLTRTSVPSLYVPIVFPSIHPYYGLDLGRPFSGRGSRTDENKVLWTYLNPETEGGAIAVPVQFALYSQAGLPAALIGPLIIGLLVGLFWNYIATSRWVHAEWKPLFSVVVVIFLIWLSMDNLRNAVIVSYGMLWGGLFLVFLLVLASVVGTVRSRVGRPYKNLAPPSDTPKPA